MSMFIDYIQNSEQRTREYHFVNKGGGTIVCPKNLIDVDIKRDMSLSPILSVQVDGDELDYVKTFFTGLPCANRRVVTYMGEYARFIVFNLP